MTASTVTPNPTSASARSAFGGTAAQEAAAAKPDDAARMAGQDALLSVIVPVYNVAPYLDACVESLVNQAWRNVEILLVDDGSTDHSGALCDAWAKKDARIRVVHQENGGLSAARNTGLDLASGAWLTFVDSDDWVVPEMFVKLIGLCEEFSADIGACAFNYVFPERVLAAGDTGVIRVFSRKEALTRLAGQHEVRFEACARIYRRAAVEGIRFVAGQVYEDIHFTRLAFTRMERYVYLDRPYYCYRQGRAGSTNTRFPEAKLAVVEECDAFVQTLDDAGLTDAALGMEAFTLQHIIRLHAGARACQAPGWMKRKLLRDYRKRYFAELDNPYIERGKGFLFACSPALYRAASKLVHWLQHARA